MTPSGFRGIKIATPPHAAGEKMPTNNVGRCWKMEGSGNSWAMRNHLEDLEEFNLDSLGLLGGTSPEKQIEGSNILSLMQDEVGHNSSVKHVAYGNFIFRY